MDVAVSSSTSSGTVTIPRGTTIVRNGLTFATNGYTVASSGAFKFRSAAPIPAVGARITGTFNAANN